MLFTSITDIAASFFPLIIVAIGFGILLWLMNYFLLGKQVNIGAERKIPRQLIMLAMTLLATIAAVLVLPISESSRNQIIALIGLLLSGVLAFASTTVFTNIMAGMMLRVTQPFKTGDFISVQEYFGRVAARGLLDTEIQTEQRELIAIPNIYLVNHPVSVISSNGALVSASVSIGYDVHHGVVQTLLLAAAKATDLSDPFVHIVELGNYSVSYKVSGLLSDVKNLITTRSLLCANVLDAFHAEKVEVMSPNFMNQRPVPKEQSMIPQSKANVEAPTQSIAEDIVFDKAEQASQKESEKKTLKKEIKETEEALKSANENSKKQLTAKLELAKEQLATLKKNNEQEEN